MVINLAICGTGIFARDSHVPALKLAGGYNLVGVYNRTESKAKDFLQTVGFPHAKIYKSLDELLADPDVDAVDCALPTTQNLDVIKKVVAAKKALAIEKPIAGSVAEAREVVQIVANADIPFLVLENWSYHKGTHKLKQLLPQIGKVLTFQHTMAAPYHDTSKYLATQWRAKPEFLACQITDGGVHQIALLTDVLGEVASASGRTVKAQKDTGDLDTLSALFNMKSGAFGSFLYGRSFGSTEPVASLTIYGTSGTLQYSFFDNKITLYEGPNMSNQKPPQEFHVGKEEIDGVVPEFVNFKDAVAAKDKTLLTVTPQAAFHHFAVLAAGIESAEKGGELVAVPQP